MRVAITLLTCLTLVGCSLFKPEVAAPESEGWPLAFSQPDTTALAVYETRGLFDLDNIHTLRLERDSTYIVMAPDGTTVQTGTFTYTTECVYFETEDCARLTRHWLHDFERVTGFRSWKEEPLNETWPVNE